MNVLNRILLVLIALAVGAAAVSLIAAVWSIPTESIDGLRDAVAWLEDHNRDAEKAVLTGIAGMVAVLALVIVLLEFLPQSGTDVKVTDLQIGDAVLSTTAIGQRVEEAVSQVAHVSTVRATIRTKRKGVVVSLDLHVDPDANLAAVTDEACGAARDVLTNRVHVALIEPPRARLHYRELRLRGGAPPARRALQAPPEPGASTGEREPVAAGVAPGEAPAEETRTPSE